jgi:hypothetical protein
LLPAGHVPKALPAGGKTTKSLKQVQNTKGTNQERGAAGNEYIRELNQGSGEKTELTRKGVRRHDDHLASPRTQTDLRNENKNYLKWVTRNGQPVLNEVQLTKELREQIDKDFLWRREGRRQGIDRRVQYDFIGAPPSAELRDYILLREGTVHVHQ